MNIVDSSWFYWAVGIAVGLPVALIVLTELHQTLVRRQSALARPVNLLRNYLLPLAALLLLLVEAAQIPAQLNSVRMLTTVFGFLVLVLLLSGLNATVFEGAPQGSWRKRVPTIFLDVTRLLLIAVGLALIFSYIWGVRVGGLFTALGVTSVVIGLMLQNSVGQIVSGLFMLFEQPFRIDDWLDTPAARGRVVEVNWRAVHIETDRGLQITPNSVLAATSFTNLSRPPGAHQLSITTTFSSADPPDRVRAAVAGRRHAAATQARQRTDRGGRRQRRVPRHHRVEVARRRRRGATRRSCGGSGTRRGVRACTSTTPTTTSRPRPGCRRRCEPWWHRHCG